MLAMWKERLCSKGLIKSRNANVASVSSSKAEVIKFKLESGASAHLVSSKRNWMAIGSLTKSEVILVYHAEESSTG